MFKTFTKKDIPSFHWKQFFQIRQIQTKLQLFASVDTRHKFTEIYEFRKKSATGNSSYLEI